MANHLYQQLTEEDLKKIINCESFDKLSILLGKDKDSYVDRLPFYQHLRKKNTSFFESLFSAITYAQLPIQILWLVTAFVSLGVAAMWIFGGVIGLAGTLLIGLSTYYTKQQHQKSLHDKNDLACMGIKIEATNELLSRRRKQPTAELFETPAIENVTVNKRESFELGLLLTLNLAFTYWGTRDLLLYVGLMSAASIFAGPFGLAIIAGATILLGVAFGIQHHYYQQKNNPLQSLKKSLEVILNKNKTVLETLEETPQLNWENKAETTLPPSQSPPVLSGERAIKPNWEEDKGTRNHSYLPQYNLFKTKKPITNESYAFKRSMSY